MNRVLVTGSNGFVGRALCQELVLRGVDYVSAIRSDRSIVPGTTSASVQVGDIGSATDWTVALRGIDTVVHLASRVHVMQESSSDPLHVFREINTHGTLNLALQAHASGVRRFVFVSTVKVNGDGGWPPLRPYSEHDQPTPQDAYALSKWEAECGLRDLARETGLEVVNIRPPLVYGPAVSANFLRLIQWVNRGWPTPFGAIHNARSLVYLGNLVDLIILCLNHPKAANHTFLVSDGEDLSTAELLRRLAHALHKPVVLLPVPASLLRLGLQLCGQSEVAQRLLGSLQVDISAARTVLGWSPPFGVTEGLQRTAEHYLHTLAECQLETNR